MHIAFKDNKKNTSKKFLYSYRIKSYYDRGFQGKSNDQEVVYYKHHWALSYTYVTEFETKSDLVSLI